MSKRLVSFNGPSTPSASPAQARKQPDTPQSPSRSIETTYHRKVRVLLQETRGVARTWDELVKIDGLKAVTALTDARTDLDNALRLVSDDTQPRTRLVSSRIAIMEKSIMDLELIITKLKKQFTKLASIMDNLEEVVFEAHKHKGWAWVHSEPLWCTWTLEKFATEIPRLLPPYHRSLQLQIELVESLRSHSLSFEESQKIILKWIGQPHLEADEWVSEWEDLCAVEIERWIAR
ncbi:hypothetical protein EW145_g5332 [Phellinidium pouzarii]|uniref:Uncharacterized protein n=1 Tax=Phellinidium pouzarii TaxID=167371 RepID=A0A4S4L0X0_9AGAM|nr:hypothetical protein EW145_g5332 [Phellinidium pouzarii]